ncbi:MAG: ComEC/Rec2 family competence protein [Clostridia bacterium]|nr:ComEC/Rec2 family competence protein [Clostridia bacterium]
MKRPLIISAIISVILSGALIKASSLIAILILIINLVLFVLTLSFRPAREFCVFFAVALIISANSMLTFKTKIEPIPENADQSILVLGTVTKEYYNNSKGVYVVKTSNQPQTLPGGINITVRSGFTALSCGQKIECLMYVSPVKENIAYNYSNGIFATANIKTLLSCQDPSGFAKTILKLKNGIENTLFSNLSFSSAAVVNAITLGNDYYNSAEFETFARRSGVSHIMVVSGMHMAILCGSVLKILNLIGVNRKLSAVVTAVFLLFLMALCGFTMSVLRAGFTYFIMLFGLFIYRRIEPLNSLCAAVCIIIMLNPFAVGSVSFVLSVSATAGIILLSDPIANFICNFVKIKSRVLTLVVFLASVTLAATLATLPFTVYYFGVVSLVSVITNLLIDYAVSLALILAAVGMVASALHFPQFIISGTFFLCEIITRYFTFIITAFGRYPNAEITINKTFGATFFTLTIFAVTYFCYKNSVNNFLKKVVLNNAYCHRAIIKTKH